jgi:hypothetical protein
VMLEEESPAAGLVAAIAGSEHAPARARAAVVTAKRRSVEREVRQNDNMFIPL